LLKIAISLLFLILSLILAANTSNTNSSQQLETANGIRAVGWSTDTSSDRGGGGGGRPLWKFTTYLSSPNTSLESYDFQYPL